MGPARHRATTFANGPTATVAALPAGLLVDVAPGAQGQGGRAAPLRRAQDRDDFPQHLGHVEVRAARRQLAPDALAGLVVAPLG